MICILFCCLGAPSNGCGIARRRLHLEAKTAGGTASLHFVFGSKRQRMEIMVVALMIATVQNLDSGPARDGDGVIVVGGGKVKGES